MILPSSSPFPFLLPSGGPPLPADPDLRTEVARACTRLCGMSTRLETVEGLIAIDAASAARRVRAAVAELDRIVAGLQRTLAPPDPPGEIRA